MAERPTGQGFYLGEQLKRLRLARGMSLAAVAGHLGCSEAKISRLEGGRSKLRSTDLVTLLDLFEVTGAHRAYLIEFCSQQEVRSTGWWREHSGHQSDNIPQYLALEAVASHMRNIEPALIPGLLQTPAYARVALRAKQEGAGLDRETGARLARRRRILDGGLAATFLLGQTAVDLIPPDVRDGQLAHLIELAALPNVSVRLIPREEIAYLTHGAPLVLLSFDLEGLDPVAYLEHWAASWVVDEPADVARCFERFEMVEKSCLTGDDTMDWLKDIRAS